MMNAPLLWIGLPLILAPFFWLPRRAHITAALGGIFTLGLALLAWFLPVDTAFRVTETLSFKLAASFDILGRQIIISQADQPLIALIYAIVTLWFFGASIAGIARRLVPIGMGISALFIASLSVQPFLYAALLIQTAVLIAVPLLSPPEQKPGRGILRFLSYQTLAMPFILFSGWLLAGVESSPGDIALLTQAATLLALGFAFLLAIFPLYTWIPMLMEEASPYAVGFMLWLLPNATLLFALSFLDRYAWLREFEQLPTALQLSGLLMLVTGGVWAAFQRHLGRIMGYVAIANTGFMLLSLSLFHRYQLSAFFLLLPAQAVSLLLWSLTLSILKLREESLLFKDRQGDIQRYPIVVVGVLASHFSLMGMPLFASFPPVFAIWEGVAEENFLFAIWVGVGVASLLTGAIRSLAVLVMAPEDEGLSLGSHWSVMILISGGVFMLLVLGFFPQILQPLISRLSEAFSHLAG